MMDPPPSTRRLGSKSPARSYYVAIFALGVLCGGAFATLLRSGGLGLGSTTADVATARVQQKEAPPHEAAAWRNASGTALLALLERKGVPTIVPTGNHTSQEEEGVPADPAWRSALYDRLNRIRLICGSLCQISTPEEVSAASRQETNEAAYFSTVAASDVDCSALLASDDIDAGDLNAPAIPSDLRPYFTFGGKLGISGDGRRKDIYLGGESETKLWPTGSLWKEDDINACVAQAGDGTLKGSYGVDEATKVRDEIVWGDPGRLRDKSVLVIGSSHPWIECICLHHGARMVTTLEYGTITSEHPKIRTETPRSFRDKYLAGELGTFDGVVTHSSLEHSGLGRYGDALNPWGDILALARAWCVTREGGFLWLGLPVGKDFILSNWHRVYGPIRLPLIAANWKQIGGPRSKEEEAVVMSLGKWKSMANTGHLFERLPLPDQ